MKVDGIDVSNVKSWEELQRYTAILFRQVTSILNNGIVLSDNFNAKIVSVTFNVANSDVSFSHGLARAPIGYISIGNSAAMQIYNGAAANTTDIMFLRSSATGTAQVLVF